MIKRRNGIGYRIISDKRNRYETSRYTWKLSEWNDDCVYDK